MRAATYDDVVNNVKLIMNEKGMKQKIVAERAGFSDAEFSNMLNERRKLIRIEHIPKIAKALGVEPNELYGIASEGEKKKEPTLNDIRKANGLKPIPEGDVILILTKA